MLNIKIVGDKALMGNFKEAARKVPSEAFQTMRRATLLLQRTVMKEKLSGQVLNVKTGRLRSSITARTDREAEDITGRVGTNVIYGKFWEMGGRIPAFTIRPKKAKVLRFYIRGKAVFSMFAKIPARTVKARPFLAPALQEKTDVIMKMFGEAMERVT